MQPPVKVRTGLPCPICHKEAKLSYHDYGERHDCYKCGMRGWNGKDLVSIDTINSRKKAHKAFDPIWRVHKIYPRNDAYMVLAEAMGQTRKQCHIGNMSKQECEMVVRISKQIIKDHNEKEFLWGNGNVNK